jgi:polyisoprenoid-binding protein YceI
MAWPRACRASLALVVAMAGPTLRSGPALAANPQPVRALAATLHEGTLSFDGHATTGDFVGTTNRVTGAVLASPDYASLRGWVEAPVATLRTGNGLRDRDLRKVMAVDRHPTVRYDLTGAVTGAVAGADSVHLVLHGALRLHGVSRFVAVPVVVARSGDTAHVTGTFPLNVTDYGVGGLRKMGGLLRMREVVEIHLALRFVIDP